ncbi:MAG TPA: SDR family oxidoreductase [Anaerolineales bacterium]|nr:SDR family oxidoreductase [Anaerolineales bacterium]
MHSFGEKVILITGAGRGLGRALAKAFAAAGGRVAVNDFTPINLDQTVEEIRAAGGEVRDYLFDTGKKMPVQALVESVRSDFGALDVLVHCAAILPKKEILELDEWDWRRAIDVNVNGPFFLAQSVGRVMKEQASGVILNICLPPGGFNDEYSRAVYLVSRSGLISLTRAAATEMAAFGVRVNAICPGSISGEGSLLPLASGAGWPAEMPQVQSGRMDETARLALFLCGPEATNLTGQAIRVEHERAETIW